MRPLVSVLLPVRDEAPYLAEALASLSAQTLEDFEVVVVDDGSRDGSAEIAEKHARDDARLRVLRQPRRGLVSALERARAEARGLYLARMDGDDLALPHRFEVQIAALEADERLAACGGGIEYFPEETMRDGARRYQRWINGLVTESAAARDVFVECPIPHPTLLARHEVVEYRQCDWPEDYDFVLRLWRRGERFRNVDDVVLRWRDHPGRLSRTEARYSREAFVRCKVAHLRDTLLSGFEHVLVWGAGPVGKAFARELGPQVVAFADVDPRKVGKRIYGAPVVSIEDAPRFSDAFAIGAVAGAEPRAEIRATVATQGRRDGVDFVAVA
jgi:glycosyltransferase involved in cell wall biosynthesis